MRYLLDTDTCVDLLRGVQAVVQKLRLLTPDDCRISAISGFELFAGAARARHPEKEGEKIERLLSVIEQLPFDAAAARRAGLFRWELEQAGTRIGPYDLLIAGHAFALKLTLVTANTREFSRLSELRFENWR